MALTRLDYELIAAHAIGAFSSTISPTQVVKESLRHLFDMHAWSWRSRPPANLDLTASQSWVALPPDFGQLLAVEPTDNSQSAFNLVTLDQLQLMRGTSLTGDTTYWFVAVAFPTQTSTTVNAGAARLEIYPTPASSDTNAAKAIYLAGPIDMAASADVPNIPANFEGLLTRICRAMARYYEDDNSAELDALDQSPFVHRLKQADGGVQRTVIPITGGAAQIVRPLIARAYDTYTSAV